MLGRYLSYLRVDHWKATKRISRYLQRTKNYMLTYRVWISLRLLGILTLILLDACYIYLWARGVVSWKSAKQSLIVSSTMAVMFITCYETSNHGIWLRNFVTWMRIIYGVYRPLKLFCDNKSTVLYSNNNKSQKYTDIKFLTVKEKFRVYNCLWSRSAQTLWLWIYLLRDCHLRCLMSTLLV